MLTRNGLVCRLAAAAVLGMGVSAMAAPADATKPAAQQYDVAPLMDVARATIDGIQRDVVAAEDAVREEQGMAPRFAIPHDVFITPANDGTWERLDGDTLLWRLRVTAKDATSINLGFTRYQMPKGGRLMFYTPDFKEVVRPFTDRDNAAHGELWTPALPGEEIIVELTIPEAVLGELQLELTSINYGYRGFWDRTGGGLLALSGSCNYDVVCPEGDGWELEIASVGVISTGGSTFCTGFMVNNTAQDLKPYFMTADHCGIGTSNAASLVVYWNFENSVCRPAGSPASGGPGDGLLNQFQSGSFYRSEYSASDMTLVELDEDPNPAWDVAYAGWDRSGAEATTAIAIHHPNTDEKRISFEFQATQTTSYLGTTVPGNGTHVRVIDWDLGTTEPGSSGSPLFDQNHRVIGQLHGGYAACGNDDSDWYGRFSVSWNGGGTNSSRLSNWLDPLGTGAMTVNTISLATLCSDEGEVSLDRANYACQDTVTIDLVDCGPNVNPALPDAVVVTLSSDSEPAGETVVLTEQNVDSGQFRGSLQINTVNSTGVLLVAPGDTITVTYNDAEYGDGGPPQQVTDTAGTDCTPPVISGVQTLNIEPRDATVRFSTNEPATGLVRYGTSCASLGNVAEQEELNTTLDVLVTGLNDETTYYYEVEAVDEAGNASVDDNGGQCYSFTTPEVPDFFTEIFEASDNDLNLRMVTFTPNGTIDYYGGCAEVIAALPTDPTGGTTLSLGDDSFAQVSLGGGQTVSLYGVSYSSFYVGSNGYVTFGAGDDDWTESLTEHFGPLPRISALYDDFSPNQAGTVSWKQLADRVAITWLNVTEYNALNQNTFQIEMFFDGTIRLSYVGLAARDGLVGLARGDGLSPDYFESNISSLAACGANPPLAATGQNGYTKSRYICFAPNNDEAVNFRVEMMSGPGSPGVVGWVDVPNGDGIARLVSTPGTPRVWTEPVVFVADCAIAPAAVYSIRSSLDGANFSADYQVSTTPQPTDGRAWGDVVGGFSAGVWLPPDGSVNGFDIVAVVSAFQIDPDAPHISRVDLNPEVPDGLANGADILTAINAFGQAAYPFSTPDSCP